MIRYRDNKGRFIKKPKSIIERLIPLEHEYNLLQLKLQILLLNNNKLYKWATKIKDY